MTSAVLKCRGENGHAELTAEGLGDSLLALYDKMVRGLPEHRLQSMVAEVLAEAHAKQDKELVKNIFVLAFHTRWCRGGKGERKISYLLLLEMYKEYPAVVLELVGLLPSYGYWKDLLSLLLQGADQGMSLEPLQHKVWSMFASQLTSDMKELEEATQQGRPPRSMSLAAKFAPSEGGQHSKVLGADKEICKMLFPALVADGQATPSAQNKYRRMLSKLRQALALPEVLMCAKRWAEIEFGRISSVCLDRQKKAFLNEGRRRHPEQDRLACRAHLLAAIQEKKALKGKQLFPHQLVQQVLRNGDSCATLDDKVEMLHGMGLKVSRQTIREALRRTRGNADAAMEDLLELAPEELGGEEEDEEGDSAGVNAVINAQWDAVREGVVDMVQARQAELAQGASAVEEAETLVKAVNALEQTPTAAAPCLTAAALSLAADAAVATAVAANGRKPAGLARVVAMADVSGSMQGTPMNVSIALGILASEITHPAFRDKVLTFSEDPVWHDLSAAPTFVDKVHSLSTAHWGGSTNFVKAMDKIAELVRERSLAPEDIPDLLVISDMQFDEAEPGSWDVAHKQIADRFHALGHELHGYPLEPPNIIFWNVRSDSVGYPAVADESGVSMLSGFSPALMKFVLSGEMEQEHIAFDSDGRVVKVRRRTDPRETLQRVLHESGLAPVRAVLDAVTPAMLPGSSWLP